MTVLDLKENIAKKLAEIEDVEFLNAIELMVTNKTSGETYALNDFEVSRLESAREQVKNKQTISHKKVKSEINQWLSSK